ncbi:MAG TPA: hypothetical protein VH040_03495 [Usitatibacter sp.]|jgi:hypothetical protein|nr:hypothetical protein [Usitatibacter sp.]
MRIAALCCLLALGTLPAWAQPPCKDCGMVRSVREIQKDLGARDTDVTKPSGLVATVPLGRGPDKPHLGASQRVGGDTVVSSKTWEVVVVQDDKRVRILTLDEKPSVAVGDQVRVVDGKLVPRTP